MIDLHSHVLPSIDDGSESLDVSVAMLDASAAFGFRTIFATPHLVDGLTPEYDSKVRAAFQVVEPYATARGIELVRGYEIRLAPDLPQRLQWGEPSALGRSRVVLIDLSIITWPHYLERTLFAVQTAGFQPVFAHPERYPTIQDNPAIAMGMAERGIALQATIGSFSGAFGRQAKRCAESLIGMGAVHLVASDAHSAGHRLASVPAGLRRLEALVGKEQLLQLTSSTPSALIAGESLPDPVHVLKRWWHMGRALRG